MSHGKMSDCVSFPLIRFTLVIRLRNFIWNWNTTTTNKEMVSHLNMSHGKMYDFVSFLKLTNFILKVIEILQIFFIRKDIRGIGWKTERAGWGLNEKGFWRKKFYNIRYSYLLLSRFRLFFNKCGENLIHVRYGLPLYSNHKFFIFFTAIA